MSSGRRLGLTWSEHQGRICLRVRGWTGAELRELGGLPSAELGRRLAVLPSELIDGVADVRPLQSVAGRFEIDQDAIVFVPRFPWLDGMSYTLIVDSARKGGRVDNGEVWAIQRPAPQRQATTGVVAIYPSSAELPVNQLKLYVHFSSPMSEGWAARAIHVRRADDGEPLHGVFLAAEPELWDRERRRLTLLLDPARIKRGLVPHEEAGYPLIEGVPITVMVCAEFRDAAG